MLEILGFYDVLLEGRAPGTPEAIKKIIPIITVIVLLLRVVIFIIMNVRWLAARTLVVYALVSVNVVHFNYYYTR